MQMTNEQKRNAALMVAHQIADRLRVQGNRLYHYKNYYYLRINGGKGWLEDLENRDEIIFELHDEGLLDRPWTKYKRIITDELLRLAKYIALPVNTKGVNWDDYAKPGFTDRMQAVEFVNACDEVNTYQMKGN
jgi:hypothetical protein